ncbi:MAG: orotidine-5'-phosphate decarboxylase [Lentisphaeria bacterium]
MQAHFADTLITRVRSLGHPLCAGLDPHLDQIPPLFQQGDMSPGNPATAESVLDFFQAYLPRLQGKVAVVKPQSAFFEQLGWRGAQVLSEVCAQARELGLIVVLDAKRGDIGSTAAAYAQYLATAGAWSADALTVNPYLGTDTLAPFANIADSDNAGIFVLVKTSNPGSGDYQDQLVDGVPLYELVARSLAPTVERLRGPQTGWSSLDIVVGATYPEQALAIRGLLPQAVFLIPGYGAQGGTAADAVVSFIKGPAGLEGGIVNSSRGVLFPDDSNCNDATAWEQAIDAALDRAIDELGTAVAS